MKHTTLTPPPLKSLNIAIVSAILGLGAVSGANAQTQSEYSERIKQIQESANNRIQKLKLIENEDDDFNLKQGKLDQKKFQQYMVIKQSANNSTMMVLNEHAESTAQKLENLRKLFSWTTPSIGNNTTGVAKNKADIDNNINNIYELAQQQDQHSSDIKTLGKASSANTDRITKNQADIANNQADIANNINNIYDLAQQQDQHSSDIKTLAKASAANKADADAKFKGVQTDIANNKITLANHAKKINDNQKAIEAKLGGKVDLQKLAELKTSVDKNQADIADNINNIHELAQQQDQHGSDIRTLAKAGITNKDAIAKNTQSITTLDNKVNTFDGRISALDAKVNGFDGRINALDDKVENSMAAQAALNGLFQPYNVGKVSVSAAVGAYGSKSAIAVGAGYRVNPHLAFKGGAAINTSGSRKGSYNLGINYEF